MIGLPGLGVRTLACLLLLLSATQALNGGPNGGPTAEPSPPPDETSTPANTTDEVSPAPSPGGGGCATAVQSVLQYQCAAGSECLAQPPKCDRQGECDPCPAGFVSVEGEPCESCAAAGPGKVANTDQTVCVACSPGKEPVPDRSGCSDCVGARVSTYGIECVECPILAVANAERTICQACPAGKGPNDYNTGCDACGLGQYSTVGMCQDCAAPRVVNPPACVTSNGSACAGLIANGTACEGSAADEGCMYMAGRTQCGACPAGKGPTADSTGCTPCQGNKVSTQGECIECAPGRVANENRVGCENLGDAPLNDVSTALEVLSTSNFEPITRLELEVGDSNALLPGPVQRAYIDALRADLAASLNVSIDLIRIANFGPTNAGRRRLQGQAVEFDLLITGTSASESLMELTTQLADPSSNLMSSSTAGSINPNVLPVFSFACPAGLHRPLDAAGMCVACPNPESQVPDRLADFRSCRECLPGQVPDVETGSQCVCAQGYYNATQGTIRCYESGADWKRVNTHSDAECAPCAETGCIQGYDPSNAVFGQITCQRGKVVLNPGFGVSVASKSESVPFDQIQNRQRGVFPCASDSCIVESGRPACVEGHTGPLCANCAAGYSRPGFVGRCKECAQTMSAIWVVLGGAGSLGLIVTGLYLVSVEGSSSGKISALVTLAKIGISLVQVLTSLQFTLRVQWPVFFLVFLNLLKVFSFDLLGFVDVGCVSSYTYYSKVAFAAVMPLVLLGGVAVVYKVRQSVEGIGNRCIRMALSVVFLVYPFISATVFQGFSCRQTDEDESWLDVDFQIDCNSPEYLLEFWTFGVLGMFVYPIGIPTLTLFMLVKNSDSIKTSLAKGETNPAAERYSFLTADYRPSFYYWCASKQSAGHSSLEL